MWFKRRQSTRDADIDAQLTEAREQFDAHLHQIRRESKQQRELMLTSYEETKARFEDLLIQSRREQVRLQGLIAESKRHARKGS